MYERAGKVRARYQLTSSLELLTLKLKRSVGSWGAYVASKFYKIGIERENLNLRNRLKRLNRKTLGYSKSPEMHDKIIGTFIEREHYLL
ncbi:IS1 family transposase [Providencia rettgeri]